jgi:hypothetical protein
MFAKMGVPPNHPNLVHFRFETHGDLGLPHFKKHPSDDSTFLSFLLGYGLELLGPIFARMKIQYQRGIKISGLIDKSWVFSFGIHNLSNQPHLVIESTIFDRYTHYI